MKQLIILLVACGMLAACSQPKVAVFNMSVEERPFALQVDAIEGDTIYISIPTSVFEDTLTRNLELQK